MHIPKKYLNRHLLLVGMAACWLGIAQSQGQQIPLKHGAHRSGPRTDAAMQTWRGYGLGQFIHWGVYAMLEGAYQGKNYAGAAEWIRAWKEVPNAVYDSLYTRFNPSAFNARAWAAMAKQMGVRYLTFTTKHHDGFCLWPSAFTNYTIANTPFKRDIVKEVVDAYTQAGIDVYLYFSVLDWNHPGWRYQLKNSNDSIAFNTFKQFTWNQLTELATRYPSIKGFWFDGTWDESWKKSGPFTDSLEQHLKSLIPGLVIGSRLRADELGNRHKDANGNLMGDYEQGWERKIPDSRTAVGNNDWECVMTIPENGWGYAKKWMGHWKTPVELLEMTAKCVSLGGNFVINFGPMANGAFRPEEEETAATIGRWMKQNHQAIYNSSWASGWAKQDWGYITQPRQPNKINLIVFNVPVAKTLLVKPPKGTTIVKATLMVANKTALTIKPVDYGEVQIILPAKWNAAEPFVIELQTEFNQKQNNAEGPKANT